MDAHTASAARGHSHRVVGRAQSLLAGPPVSYSVPQPDPFRKIDHQASYYPFLTIFQINPERQRRLIPLRLGTLFGAVRPLWECGGCGKQTSVTAGTIMHHSKLPLTTWFWAAYLMATHSNGISALQLQRQLALGSYKSACLMFAKLRRSMVAPGRSPLAGPVEVDKTEIICSSKNDPSLAPADAAIKAKSSWPVRWRSRTAAPVPAVSALAKCPITRLAACTLFLRPTSSAVLPPRTDGWSGYPGAPGVDHDPHVVGNMAAHIVLP